MNRELLETLMEAAVARELGDDKAALKFLDAACEFIHRGRALPDTSNIKIVPRERRGRGRPSPKRDPDASAVSFMEHIAQKGGPQQAETLARSVLRIPGFRRANRKAIGESDIKRLAAKFRKAKPKI